jgi:hypothetical protein
VRDLENVRLPLGTLFFSPIFAAPPGKGESRSRASAHVPGVGEEEKRIEGVQLAARPQLFFCG